MSTSSSSSSIDMFAWELLHKVNERIIRDKNDLIICFTHWLLLHRGFRCAGLGEDTGLPRHDEVTELLPEGWNLVIPYKIRYVYDRKLYFLTGLTVDDEIVLNLNRPVDERVFGAVVKLSQVQQLKGPIIKVIPKYVELIQHLNEDLIDPLVSIEVTKEVETQTSDELLGDRERDRPRRPLRSVQEVELPAPPTFPLIGNVGTADLDPLLAGGQGGGMLFEPPGMGPRGYFVDPEMPQGAVPPGARYDPIRPAGGGRPRPGPGHSRPSHPDHDHLPPPGYDDMFM